MIVNRPRPLVTAITPFLDPSEPAFREAIESVLAQSYRPLEYILVDDGSDPSLAERLAREFKNTDVRMRWIQHPSATNEGISASRNLGVAEASGVYVAFLDADDLWLAHKIQRQVEIMEAHPDVAMVFGQTLYWNNHLVSDRQRHRDFTPFRSDDKSGKFLPPEYFLRIMRDNAVSPSMSNLMLRREMLNACGGFEDEFRTLYEDQVMVAKICIENSVYSIPECWDKYRQHDASICRRANHKETVFARRRFLLWLEHFCRTRGHDNPEIREAIAKNLWMNLKDCRARPSKSYSLVRWTRKWQLRIEKILVPAFLRRRRWSESRIKRLRSDL